MTTYANIEHNLSFIERRESSAVRQALQAVTALHDAVSLKREIRLPVLAETRDAILGIGGARDFSETGIAAGTTSRSVDAPRHVGQRQWPSVPSTAAAILFRKPGCLAHLLHQGIPCHQGECCYCARDHVHCWRSNGHDPLVLPSRCGAGDYLVPMVI